MMTEAEEQGKKKRIIGGWKNVRKEGRKDRRKVGTKRTSKLGRKKYKEKI